MMVYGSDMFFDTSNSNLRQLCQVLGSFFKNGKCEQIKSVTKVEYDKDRKCVSVFWEEEDWNPLKLAEMLTEIRSICEGFERVVYQEFGVEVNFTGSEFYIKTDQTPKELLDAVRRDVEIQKEVEIMTDFLSGKSPNGE